MYSVTVTNYLPQVTYVNKVKKAISKYFFLTMTLKSKPIVKTIKNRVLFHHLDITAPIYILLLFIYFNMYK